MADIKLGIVGSNFVSDWLIDAVHNTDGINAYALYSRSEERALEYSKKHGIIFYYTDYEEFLSSDIDAVYIASPNLAHYNQAHEAIMHKKHVLLEKPACLTSREFKILSDEAREQGVVLIEAMRPAHDPVLMKAKEIIPALGPIRRCVFEFCQYSSRYDRFKAGEYINAFNPKLGNAAVMDIGVYAIHACVMMFGRPASIKADSYLFDNGMEATGKAILFYDGFECEIVYSKIFDSVSPSFITGENGSIVIGKISTGENAVLKMRKEEPVPLVSSRPDTPELNMIYEVEDFRDAITKQTDISHFTYWTYETLRIIDEIRVQNAIVFD